MRIGRVIYPRETRGRPGAPLFPAKCGPRKRGRSKPRKRLSGKRQGFAGLPMPALARTVALPPGTKDLHCKRGQSRSG